MNKRIGTIVAAAALELLVCGFQPEYQDSPRPTVREGLESQSTLTLKTQPLQRQNELKQFSGCWTGTIHRSDVDSIQPIGTYRLGGWFDEQYVICFRGQKVSVKSNEVSAEAVEYEGTTAKVESVTANNVQIRANVKWVDLDVIRHHRVTAASRRLPHPYECEQSTMMTATRTGNQLSVTATATENVNGSPAYRSEWHKTMEYLGPAEEVGFGPRPRDANDDRIDAIIRANGGVP